MANPNNITKTSKTEEDSSYQSRFVSPIKAQASSSVLQLRKKFKRKLRKYPTSAEKCCLSLLIICFWPPLTPLTLEV